MCSLQLGNLLLQCIDALVFDIEFSAQSSKQVLELFVGTSWQVLFELSSGARKQAPKAMVRALDDSKQAAGFVLW